MSEGDPPVFLFDGDDPEMLRATGRARSTFRYLWREIAWERRRIVPALTLAYVKVAFSDGPRRRKKSDAPEVEHMWISEVDYDGEAVSGTLVNEPRWLRTVEAGDAARVPVAEISDWMYAISGQVYGAYTVNLLRARMSRGERAGHDAAWGLEFGDPRQVRIPSEHEPHPLSLAMAPSLREHLARNPKAASQTGPHGWTLLHQDASAGSAATVEILLRAGADPNRPADNGQTPLSLAQGLGWDAVAEMLRRR